MKDNMIGEAIKARRKALGINQRTLAMLAEVSVNTIVGMEKGTTQPSLATVTKVLDTLGLQLKVELKE